MVLPALFTLFFVVSAFSQGGVPEPPKLISTPKVDYPTVAKDSDIYGAVFVRVSVDEAGNVTSAQFARGPGSVCGSVTFEPVVARFATLRLTPPAGRSLNLPDRVIMPSHIQLK